MFYGQGAGGVPTSSAIMGDVVAVARRLRSAVPETPLLSDAEDLEPLSIEAAETQYYIDMQVADQEGVIAEIARVLADHRVSIESMRQPGSVSPEGRSRTRLSSDAGAQVQIVTHKAQERHLRATVETLESSTWCSPSAPCFGSKSSSSPQRRRIRRPLWRTCGAESSTNTPTGSR